MKIIIDLPKEKYEWIKKNNPNAKPDSIVGAVANGIPYKERQISHEQECIIEELENICINNEYVLGLLAKLKNGGES